LGDNFSRAVGTFYFLGFGFEHNGGTAVMFPLWLPTLLFLLPLFLAWRDHRKRLGRCTKCGYDLRASTERCPECGTPIPQRQGQRHDGRDPGEVTCRQKGTRAARPCQIAQGHHLG
jgi:hypothetical protein